MTIGIKLSCAMTVDGKSFHDDFMVVMNDIRQRVLYAFIGCNAFGGFFSYDVRLWGVG